MKNPDWTRDELILLLDVYFSVDMTRVSKRTPKVVELSTFLNKLPIHPFNSRTPAFRNPSGVHMKLRNLCRLDPTFPGAGLGRGGSLEKIVWDDFASNQSLIHNTAQAIRVSNNSAPSVVAQAWIESRGDDGLQFREGRLLFGLHKWRERNLTVVRRKKREALAAFGKLACEVCGFDFSEFYGSIGDGYAECHHVLPLSATDATRRTRLADLAIVCANCHRMLHRSQTWLSIGELRSRIND
ncbi:MAG: 5-methylcytosine-specific restriction enzyme [Pyrinomonadaceae bacterium]|nr:5-methylcytosine-specific restriction enzyme [Pyrinomonadaceae bacterium]